MIKQSINSLLLGDSRAPTGAYSYSSSLEPGVIAGLGVSDVYPFMLARLANNVRLEACACTLAHRFVTNGVELEEYKKLEAAIDARTPSPQQRKTSRALGRALGRLAKSLKPEHSGVAIIDSLENAPSRGVALGIIGAMLEIDERNLAEVCCYDDLQTVASATLKLLPVDPMVATKWVIEAGKETSAVVQEANAIKSINQLPAPCAPQIEQWAQEHAQRTRRLFVA